MKLSIKHLRTNEYTQNDEEVPEGTRYGFWRVIEHTGAGWFPLPGLFMTRADAELAKRRILDEFNRTPNKE